MDFHHLLARHHVAGLIGDPAVTAFSALPGAPVQPDRPDRRATRLAHRLACLVRRDRRPIVLASVHECRPADVSGSRMAA